MNSTGPRQRNIFRSLRRFSIFTAITFVTLSLTYFSLPLLGHWLVREDPIHQADAIAVLTGSRPMRALEAAKLYHNGYAKEIWLTHPRPRQSSDGKQSVPRPSEDVFNTEILRQEGVPKKAIHVLEMPIVNTADELNAIGSALKDSGEESVIIVTSKAHTRRVYSIWSKYHSDDGEVMVHAVTNDLFAPSSWWKTSGGKNQVIHEILGIIDVWAGMPIHPSMQTQESSTWSDPHAGQKSDPIFVE